MLDNYRAYPQHNPFQEGRKWLTFIHFCFVEKLLLNCDGWWVFFLPIHRNQFKLNFSVVCGTFQRIPCAKHCWFTWKNGIEPLKWSRLECFSPETLVSFGGWGEGAVIDIQEHYHANEELGLSPLFFNIGEKSPNIHLLEKSISQS